MLGWQIELSSEITYSEGYPRSKFSHTVEISIAKKPPIACQNGLENEVFAKPKNYSKKVRICKIPICHSLLSKLPKRDVNFQKYFLLVIKKYLGKQLSIEGLKLIIIIHDMKSLPNKDQ